MKTKYIISLVISVIGLIVLLLGFTQIWGSDMSMIMLIAGGFIAWTPWAVNIGVSMIDSLSPDKNLRLCVKCGRKIPFDAKICPYCGHNYSDSQESKDNWDWANIV